MENWVWDRDMLRRISRHYRTGRPLPDELIDRLVKTRQFCSGLKTETQLFFGLLDMAYHTDEDGIVDTTAVLNRLYERLLPYKAIPNTYLQAGFGHFVGYEAAYYGYMWALVYAQDIFAQFRRRGLLDRQIGMMLRRKILACGGSRDEMQMMRDFLGREPRMDAFLEYLGLESSRSSGRVSP